MVPIQEEVMELILCGACRITLGALLLVPLCPFSQKTKAEPLTIGRAVELAVRYSSINLPSLGPDQLALKGCSTERNSFRILLGMENATDSWPPTPYLFELVVPPLDRRQNAQSRPMLSPYTTLALESGQQQRPPPDGDSRGEIIFCTVTTYLQLVTVASQLRILNRQEFNVNRLLNIETKRVLERVDAPSALTRAKLEAAHTRLWAASLRNSDSLLRKQLADLTGIAEHDIEVPADSVPALPDPPKSDLASAEALKQLFAVRDVVQLKYALARANRMKKQVIVAMGTSNLGDLVAAYLEEQEKLIALLQANRDCLRGQVELLAETGQLENWEMIYPSRGLSVATELESTKNSSSAIAKGTGESSIQPTNPGIRSILITPATSKLKAGDWKQFSATAIYNNGSTQNATLQAEWSCSSDTSAILSKTGILTAIQKGKVTIRADFGGIAQTHQVIIDDEDWTPFDP